MVEQVWAVVANVLIALGYLGIGIWIAPQFDAAAPTWGLRATRASGLVFFVACAMTHLELAYHIAVDGFAVTWWSTGHFLIIHTIQALAAPAFLILAVRYLSLRIFNRTHYEHLLNRRLAQLRADLEREADRVGR